MIVLLIQMINKYDKCDMRKKEEHVLNETKMTMLRWVQGISLIDHIRSEEI